MKTHRIKILLPLHAGNHIKKEVKSGSALHAMHGFFTLLLPIAGLFSACHSGERTVLRDDFRKYYDSFQVQGAFALYDPQEDRYILYNPDQFRKPFPAASTFKIPHSLIALETGVVRDANFILPWDSVIRAYPKWNCDHNLRSAFRNSTVWYYQETARRIGAQRMKRWLDTCGYGNADTSGGIDRFWLSGGLRITMEQQIDFLRRLRNNQLPFSRRSVDIVKDIMIAGDTLGYTVRGNTGWGEMDGLDIGWYVGYLESDSRVYYFANCIQSAKPDNPHFAPARIAILYSILGEVQGKKDSN